jgi:hypothetical protein
MRASRRRQTPGWSANRKLCFWSQNHFTLIPGSLESMNWQRRDRTAERSLCDEPERYPSETSNSGPIRSSKPDLDSPMQRKRTIQVPDFLSRDSLSNAEFAISPQNGAKSRHKLLIIKEKDSLAGMQSSELSVELFCSKSDLVIVGVIQSQVTKETTYGSQSPVASELNR